MLVGAALAGTAIENSMLGAAHSAANPLTAHLGTIHGDAVGMLLPHVVRLNTSESSAAEIYRELAASVGAASLPEFLESLLASASMPSRLPDASLTPELLPRLAREAAAQWTAQFNPVLPEESDFLQLYAKLQ